LESSLLESEPLDANPQIIEDTKKNTQSGDYILPFVLIGLVLLIDQFIKVWIKLNYELGEEYVFAPNWGILHFTENNGIAFGTEFGGRIGKFLLTSFRILAASGLMYLLIRLIKSNAKRGLIIAFALIFAGATGNILDSIFYGVLFKDINLYQGGFFFGRVVDMFYFPVWEGVLPSWIPFLGNKFFVFFEPIFNFADASISTGVFMIILFYRKSITGF